MAGSCRRFEYDALRRRPPKPARIRGRFTDADFFFEEKETEKPAAPKEKEAPAAQKPLISDDLSQFADLWEDDEVLEQTPKATEASETSESPETLESPESPEEPAENTEQHSEPDDTQEEPCDEV